MGRRTLKLSEDVKRRVREAQEGDTSYGLVIALTSTHEWWHQLCQHLMDEYEWTRTDAGELIDFVDQLQVVSTAGRIDVEGLTLVFRIAERTGLPKPVARDIPMQYLLWNHVEWIYGELHEERRVRGTIESHVRSRTILKSHRKRLVAFLKEPGAINASGHVNRVKLRQACAEQCFDINTPRMRLNSLFTAKIPVRGEAVRSAREIPQDLLPFMRTLAFFLRELRQNRGWPGNILEQNMLKEVLMAATPSNDGEDVEDTVDVIIDDLEERDLIHTIYGEGEEDDGHVWHVRCRRVDLTNVQMLMQQVRGIVNEFFGPQGIFLESLEEDLAWLRDVVPSSYLT